MAFIIIGILGLFVLQWLLRRWSNLSPIHFYLTRNFDKERITAGESIVITTEMVNKKWLPLPWVKVYSKIPASFRGEGYTGNRVIELGNERFEVAETGTDSTYEIVTSFLFFEKVVKHDGFTCLKRGIYEAGNCHVEFGDLFGLYSGGREYITKSKLIVHPKLYALSSFDIIPLSLQGETSVKRWILPDPMLTTGTRNYTTRDHFKSINWKATAKTGQLQVKKMDHTSDQSCMVFFDVQTSPKYWEGIDRNRFELGITFAGSLFKTLFDQQIDVGIAVNSVYMMGEKASTLLPARSKSQLVKALDALAAATEYRGHPIEKLLLDAVRKLHEDAVIVIVTGYLSTELSLLVNQQARKGRSVVIYTTGEKTIEVALDRSIDVRKVQSLLSREVSDAKEA